MAPSRSSPASAFRKIPAVNDLLERTEVRALVARYSRGFITDLIREALDGLRRDMESGSAGAADVEGFAGALAGRLEKAISRRFGGHLGPVLNATGVIVHTNLGRSPLSREAMRRASSAAEGYCDLEYDLREGARGSRQTNLDSHLARLLPGSRGLVVNNNAGAVFLALNSLAEGKEVLISRGELVEIGGSFRIPDIMAKSGAILHEVGTTNRTRLGDFETALGERTGLLLKVHTSNYRIVGFVEEASVEQMAGLARRSGIPLMVDQGSGNLLDLSGFGLADEIPVGRILEAGADVVTFSGDKLLGGPQAGILCGREDLVGRAKANPIYRALRPGRMAVAALEATLETFVAGDPMKEIPTLAMLSMPALEIRRRCEALAVRLEGAALECDLVEGASKVGGGAAPIHEIATWLLALKPRAASAEAWEEGLRRGRTPVVARVRDGRLLVDLRTIPEEKDAELAGALLAALEGKRPAAS